MLGGRESEEVALCMSFICWTIVCNSSLILVDDRLSDWILMTETRHTGLKHTPAPPLYQRSWAPSSQNIRQITSIVSAKAVLAVICSSGVTNHGVEVCMQRRLDHLMLFRTALQ